jgi:hypothetical protein
LGMGYEGGIAREMARTTLRLTLLQHGFQATNEFLDASIRLSAAGRIGTTYFFRRRFCESNHYEVNRVVRGKSTTNHVPRYGLSNGIRLQKIANTHARTNCAERLALVAGRSVGSATAAL